MLYIERMEHYPAIKSSDFVKFTGKWMELENINLSDATQIKKQTIRGMNSLIIGY